MSTTAPASLHIAVGPSTWKVYRREMLRGTIQQWWSIVAPEIEKRTARAMFIESRRQSALKYAPNV